MPSDVDPEVAGQVPFRLVPGFLLPRLPLGDVDADSYGDVFLRLVRAEAT